MRYPSLIVSVLMTAAVVSPVLSQPYNFFETREELERRRQAEQYYYEKEQQKRGNYLNTVKPRPLGEAQSSWTSRGQPDNFAPNRPRECPPNNYIC